MQQVVILNNAGHKHYGVEYIVTDEDLVIHHFKMDEKMLDPSFVGEIVREGDIAIFSRPRGKGEEPMGISMLQRVAFKLDGSPIFYTPFGVYTRITPDPKRLKPGECPGCQCGRSDVLDELLGKSRCYDCDCESCSDVDCNHDCDEGIDSLDEEEGIKLLDSAINNCMETAQHLIACLSIGVTEIGNYDLITSSEEGWICGDDGVPYEDDELEDVYKAIIHPGTRAIFSHDARSWVEAVYAGINPIGIPSGRGLFLALSGTGEKVPHNYIKPMPENWGEETPEQRRIPRFEEEFVPSMVNTPADRSGMPEETQKRWEELDKAGVNHPAPDGIQLNIGLFEKARKFAANLLDNLAVVRYKSTGNIDFFVVQDNVWWYSLCGGGHYSIEDIRQTALWILKPGDEAEFSDNGEFWEQGKFEHVDAISLADCCDEIFVCKKPQSKHACHYTYIRPVRKPEKAIPHHKWTPVADRCPFCGHDYTLATVSGRVPDHDDAFCPGCKRSWKRKDEELLCKF